MAVLTRDNCRLAFLPNHSETENDPALSASPLHVSRLTVSNPLHGANSTREETNSVVHETVPS